jgi:hypothetical protein
MTKSKVGSRRDEWESRHSALTPQARGELVAQRARGLHRMMGTWRTVDDVLGTSIERRRRAAMNLMRDIREKATVHASARFPGCELSYRLLTVLLWAAKLRLHSPRYDLRATDLSFGTSAWRALQFGERRDGAFMNFLGVPAFLFDALLVKFEQRPSAGHGRRTKLTNADCLALALRFMSTTGRLKDLEQDFGAVDSILQRELWPALAHLRAVLFNEPDAQCRMPTLEEGEDMELAARARYGPPPVDFAHPACLFMDGTVLAVQGVSDKEDQAKLAYYGTKQYAVNNCMVFDQFGRIVEYVLCCAGAFHDARIARPVFEKHATEAWNPHKFALIVDSGYTGHDKTGNDGEAAVFRPMNSDAVDFNAYNELALKFSAYIVTRRQANEWANGAWKRSWPRILAPMQYSKLDKLQLVLELSVHLQNFRTRRIGFNQLTTTFMPHVNNRFKEQLLAAREQRGAAGLAAYFEFAKEDAARLASEPIAL